MESPAEQPSLIDRITRLWEPVQLQLWLDGHRQERGARAFVVRQVAIGILTVRHLFDEEISRRAAALTYYTLLALVPLLAVGFALFKAFGGLRTLQQPLKKLVVENLAAGRADEVGRWLDHFINRVSAGALAGVGLLVLLYSVVGLLAEIEKSFNRIWGVDKMRPLHRRLAVYGCLITLAPPLLGVSLSLSARLQGSSFATALLHWLPISVGRTLVSGLAASAISVVFVLAYLIVPNTRVRFRAALLGGLVAGLLWSVAKTACLWLAAHSAGYNALYGALAALPLVIVWLYYSWLITLFGVTYTYANQTVGSNALFAPQLVTTPRFRLRLAARLVGAVVARSRARATPPTLEQLAEEVGVMAPVVRRMIEFLVAQRLLLETPVDGETGFVPGRDPEHSTLADLARALWQAEGIEPRMSTSAMDDALSPLLERAERATHEALGSAALEDLTGQTAP
jgi:membrane protein